MKVWSLCPIRNPEQVLAEGRERWDGWLEKEVTHVDQDLRTGYTDEGCSS